MVAVLSALGFRCRSVCSTVHSTVVNVCVVT